MMTTRFFTAFAVRSVAIAVFACGTPWIASGQSVPNQDLTLLTLEQLLDLRIISAQRKEQRAEDVAAAVYVITQEDIRRSGLSEVPDILRLVPGMQVARMNSSEFAVSVRGFNSLYSDKLLVLVDGRSLYNRAFSGVFWDGQNIAVSDIDRIEVIRGPGGTAWGANAVNGVINIITKSAHETQGASVEVGAGSLERSSAAVRYGGALGDTAYRVYSQWTDRGAGLTSDDRSAGDARRALTTGARVDWSRDRDTVMFQGSYTQASSRPLWLRLTSFYAPPTTDGRSELSENVVLGKWTRRIGHGSLFQAQAFRMEAGRDETTIANEEVTTDVDAQYQTSVGSRHELVAGGGVRQSALTSRPSMTLDIPSDSARVFSAFLQDEISLGRAVSVTVGSKLEHDTYAGWGVLPSTRVMWKLDPSRQRVWAAVSRARRTPSAAYRGMRITSQTGTVVNGLPLLLSVLGNADYRTEELLQIDAGYRIELGHSASLDVTAFRGRYNNSTTMEASAPTFELLPSPHLLLRLQYANLLDVDTQGVEIAGRWSPAASWRVDASYATIHFTPRPDASTSDEAAARFDGNAPQHQWQIRSTAVLTPRIQADGGLYFVGRLRELAVPSYARADARLEVKLKGNLSAVLIGQNLTSARHQEFSGAYSGLVDTQVPRSVRAQLRVQF